MILEGKNSEWLSTSFNSIEEADYYYSLRDYLRKAGVWDSVSIQTLHRYCKLQFEFLDLLKSSPKHYMIDKYANHLQELEKELCLTPKSMLAYKKDVVLMQAKKAKLQNT